MFIVKTTPDAQPKLAVNGLVGAGDVVGNGDPREFDDAAFNGVHEGEIAHGPGEQRALGLAGTTQEEGRGREVKYGGDVELTFDGFDAGNPKPGGLAVFLRLPLLLRFEVFVVLQSWRRDLVAVGDAVPASYRKRRRTVTSGTRRDNTVTAPDQ